jgi:N4-gp56 family major capsid protein
MKGGLQAMATGQMLWTTHSGFLTNNKLNLRFQRAAQPILKFAQFVKFKEAFGKHQGESVNWDKVADVATIGGVLTETNVMHETKQGITQGTLSVNEYGNSIPYSRKIETLSEFDIMDIIRGGLLNDAVKVRDGLVERKFNETKLRYVGTATGGGAVTTNGTATATNTSVLNSYHIRKMKLQLEQRNVPGWNGVEGEYACICSLEALESLQGALESTNQYTETGYKKILNGEQGILHDIRLIKDSYASRFTYDSTARTSTAKSWTGANSLDAYMFGSPTVREAIVVPMEIRMKVVTDYGRSKGMAWYMIGGWAIEWDTAADTRIIKWDSA